MRSQTILLLFILLLVAGCSKHTVLPNNIVSVNDSSGNTIENNITKNNYELINTTLLNETLVINDTIMTNATVNNTTIIINDSLIIQNISNAAPSKYDMYADTKDLDEASDYISIVA